MPTLAKKVFLSSTFIDLKDYREAAIHACRRVGLIPVYMEDFPPDPRDAIAFCKAKVEEADLFLGVYAHRYGYVPDGSKVSITEMEYGWAVEQALPVHLFIIDSDYPWPPIKIDKGRDFKRLESFKKKIGKDHTLKKFRDVETFKEDVLLLGHDLARSEASSPSEKSAPARRSLPTPPELHSVPPYIQTTGFIGRRKELDDLDAWARSSDTVLVVEAIGGVGKSALTWEWVRDRAKKAMPEFAGILWWSFYEGGASTASFVREALAYVTRTDPEDLRSVPQDEQVQRLLTELRHHPYLFVLDGFERLLTAYHQLDPSKLQDDQVKTDHRACTNPQTEDLLRQLVGFSPSKFLITTRLMPSSLENRAHQPLPSVCHLKLPGLDSADGENLLKSLGIHGDSATIRRFLRRFDNHSLLIGVLAGRILDYRPAPGDFDRWLGDPKEGGGLRLSRLDLKQRRTHILTYAFDGLGLQEKQLLSRIAALSDGADYATLAIFNPYLPLPPEKVSEPELKPVELELLHIRQELGRSKKKFNYTQTQEQIEKRRRELRQWQGQQETAYQKYQDKLKAYLESSNYKAAIAAFDTALNDLENRGLLQWDRHSNTYDLHPVVRGYAFDQLEESDRLQTYERIRDHFESLPPDNLEEATDLTHIKNTIRIYQALVGAGQLDKAADLYTNSLSQRLLSSIASYPTVAELLKPLFKEGLERPPSLRLTHSKLNVVDSLGSAYRLLRRFEEAKQLSCSGIRLALDSKEPPALISSILYYSFICLDMKNLAASLNYLEMAHRASLASENESGVARSLLWITYNYTLEGRFLEAQYKHNEFLALPKSYKKYIRPGDLEFVSCTLSFYQNLLQPSELKEAISVAHLGKNLPAQLGLYNIQSELALQNKSPNEAIDAAEIASKIARKSALPLFMPRVL